MGQTSTPAANDKAASSPKDASGFLDPATTEQCRSEWVKREKTDDYDASEFERKTKANNTTASRNGPKQPLVGIWAFC